MSNASPATDQAEIPLARPSLGEQERTRVAEVLESSRLSRGPALAAFEARMAEVCGTDHAVAVSSGTAALHCIVRSLDLEPGSEVLTTPFSFVASTNVLLYEDLVPRFVDIDPTTFNLDVDRVADDVSPETEGILGVDVFGTPADWPALRSLADTHDLHLIDDACEAVGASIADRPIGSFGDAAAFGFYPNKQITTGEGGCITTNDASIARACRSLRNHGRSDTDHRMRHPRLGFNYRLDELSAALGCAQLDRLDDLLAQRKRVADHYREVLTPLADDLDLPVRPPDDERSWFVYVVRLRDHFADHARDQLMEALEANGIGCAPYFPPIHLQPYHRSALGYSSGDFPVCERVSARCIALPFYPSLSRDAVRRVGRVLEENILSLPRRTR